MAKKESGDHYSSRENAKVADIITASKSLVGEDYSAGYPDVMRVHMNQSSATAKERKGGK